MVVLEVIFKSVGQGDCIVIEWNDDVNRVGIVDCHAEGSRNPAIDHVKSIGCDAIEFVVLSHPHSDHYSGLPDLLEYCRQHSIVVKRFLHTASFCIGHIQTVVAGTNSRRLIVKLLLQVEKLHEDGVIREKGTVTDTTGSIELGDGISLEFLAPSDQEISKYQKSAFREELQLKSKPDANWLSTLIRIDGGEWYALLTGDVYEETLRRVGIEVIRREVKQRDRPWRLVAGQVPHHGSAKSHYREFWKTKQYEPKTPLGLSVGLNNKHDHPADGVVEELKDLEYDVRSTAEVSSYSGLAKKARRLLGNAQATTTGSGSVTNDVVISL